MPANVVEEDEPDQDFWREELRDTAQLFTAAASGDRAGVIKLLGEYILRSQIRPTNTRISREEASSARNTQNAPQSEESSSITGARALPRSLVASEDSTELGHDEAQEEPLEEEEPDDGDENDYHGAYEGEGNGEDQYQEEYVDEDLETTYAYDHQPADSQYDDGADHYESQWDPEDQYEDADTSDYLQTQAEEGQWQNETEQWQEDEYEGEEIANHPLNNEQQREWFTGYEDGLYVGTDPGQATYDTSHDRSQTEYPLQWTEQETDYEQNYGSQEHYDEYYEEHPYEDAEDQLALMSGARIPEDHDVGEPASDQPGLYYNPPVTVYDEQYEDYREDWESAQDIQPAGWNAYYGDESTYPSGASRGKLLATFIRTATE